MSDEATNLRAGEWVEVRDAAEILATLDERGELEGLPFMPEMRPHCGRRFRVHRRVDLIYDTVRRTGLRRLRGTVTLDELRCDGHAHGGCQAGCRVLWKERWLRRAAGAHLAATVPEAAPREPSRLATDSPGGPPPEPVEIGSPAGPGRLSCQLTQVHAASTPLAWWDARHELRVLWSGNVTLAEFVTGILIRLFRWVQRHRGGATYPHLGASLLTRTPEGRLDLQPGEWVEVRGRDEILRTLDTHGKNRGLWFDADMIRYCGRRFRVRHCVERLIDEKTGRLVTLRNPCIVLDGVTATGELMRFCAQGEYLFWREVWLRRVGRP